MLVSRSRVVLGIAVAWLGCSSSPTPLPEQNSSCIGERITQGPGPKVGGQCLPQSFTVDAETLLAPCIVVEARNTGGACDCGGVARTAVAPAHENAVESAKQDPLASTGQWDCFCEIPQVAGAELVACRTDASDPPVVEGQDVDGWCYIDATKPGPAAVDPELTEDCPESERRLIRFVGAGSPTANSTVFITCCG